MAKRATAKEEGGRKKTASRTKPPSESGRGRARGGDGKSSASGSQSSRSDPVDALIKLLQSPLVIDLLAVGATAALAAITEHRSARAEATPGNSKRALKAAGKAAAAAIGRRIASEVQEIRTASRKARDSREAREAGEAA